MKTTTQTSERLAFADDIQKLTVLHSRYGALATARIARHGDEDREAIRLQEKQEAILETIVIVDELQQALGSAATTQLLGSPELEHYHLGVLDEARTIEPTAVLIPFQTAP